MVAVGTVASAVSQPTQIRIDSAASGKPISPDLVGIFFEDINYAADGGLYAELVQNRSFEYSLLDNETWNPLTAWESVSRGGAKGSLKIIDAAPIHANNPHYLVVETREAGEGFGVMNSGFDGIAVQAGEQYDFSVFARQLFVGQRWGGSGRLETPSRLIIRLESISGQLITDAELKVLGREWQRLTLSMAAARSEENARLVILCPTRGAVALDVVSLFPKKTFKNRSNGLRADLAQVVADLKPKFVRFPGGCLVHGYGLGNIYRWQDTIGPIEQRRGQPNIWGYHQSVGLGYFEFFQFCEDIGAKPLPVVAAGVCCQNADYQAGTGQRGFPMNEMPAYVQDVLDLIEWANGPTNSTWGAKRAAAGHPEPFNLQYLGVGNEDHITPVFKERFKMIFDAIKAKHPEITVIGTVGPAPAGDDYENGWEIASELKVPMVDEHYYESPQWFWNNLNRYDVYDRAKSKVYLGEYASRGNTLANAIAEAAYLTGLERNADVVPFASYAPLLAKQGRTQWNPDLIYFSNTKIAPTVNYYVQQLFSQNGGDVYLPTTVKESAVSSPDENSYGVFLGTWDAQAEFDNVRLSDGQTVVVDERFDSDAPGWRASSGQWTVLNGTYRQSGSAQPAISRFSKCVTGANYTLTLRARKTGGTEGFLIGFKAKDDSTYYWWNLGGWGNTRDVVEKADGYGKRMVGGDRSMSIESNRWYDIQVEVLGTRIKCYLDGKLMHDITDAGFADGPDFAASTVRDSGTGDLIVKLVNGAGKSKPVKFEIQGAGRLAATATVTVLANEDPKAVNDFSNPHRVIPKTSTMAVGAAFEHSLPSNSLTVIRIPKR